MVYILYKSNKLRSCLFEKTLIPKTFFLSLLLLMFFEANSQTPNDAIMMPSKDACLLLNFDGGSFNQYWEGEKLRKNETIATVSRATILPMVAIGIVNNLNVYLSVPYIQTKSSIPNGGRFAGASGFQDLGVALKYRFLNKETTKGEWTALGTTGFSHPVTNYLSDYMPYSLGTGAPEAMLSGILQYKWKTGPYLRGSVSHMWRGYTEAERDYYYNNGSYYTAWMDVPNAFGLNATAGYWLLQNSLKLEANYWNLQSTSGDDIRAYNAAQPTNKVMFGRVGLAAQYYFPFAKGLGVVVNHSRVTSGRNTAKMNNSSLGLTYQFSYR